MYDVIFKIKYFFCLDQYNNSDKLESYTSAKRLKSNFKKELLHLRVTGVYNNNMKLNKCRLIRVSKFKILFYLQASFRKSAYSYRNLISIIGTYLLKLNVIVIFILI